MNLRPLGYEPSELPDCSTPHEKASVSSHASTNLGQRSSGYMTLGSPQRQRSICGNPAAPRDSFTSAQ